MCRLLPRTSRILPLSLGHRWTLSQCCTLLRLRTAGILLQLLCSALFHIPFPVLQCRRTVVPGLGVAPALVGLLLLVRVPRRRGCLGSRLVSRVVRSLLLGRLPVAGLLLLIVQDAVLGLTRGLHLDARMRTVRRSSLRWTLFRWWPPCSL